MEKFEKNNKWIFLIPVDGNTNKNISKNNNELFEKNKKEKEKNIKEDSINKINCYKNTISHNNNEEKNCRIYSYSSISKNKSISNADSSKFYMSDFLKKNWKIKIKRLLVKLKKRYTKQSQKLLEEGPDTNIHNSFNINNNIIINKNNSINFDNYRDNYNICESKRFANKCNVNELYNNYNYYNYYTFNFNNSYNNCK